MMATQHRVDPRVRAYGKARIDITRRAKDEQEWQRMWKDPRYSFPFKFGATWKHCIEYRVDDFAAEVGFFMDVLGFPALAFSPSFAMFTSPGQEFSFSVAITPEGCFSTPPDSIRLQFMVEDILRTAAELEQRGVKFEQQPEGGSASGGLISGYFRTPHGICIDLMGYSQPALPRAVQPAATGALPAELEVEDQEDESELDIERMPLFSAPIEADDPLFQYPGENQEHSNGREAGLKGSSADRASDVESDLALQFDLPEPPLPTTRAGSPKPAGQTRESRNDRLSKTSRLDPFRRNGEGKYPADTRRARYSMHPHPGRSQSTLSPSIRGRTLSGKDGALEKPVEPQEPGQGDNDLQPEAGFSPPVEPVLETPQVEAEQIEEPRYEDIIEEDDYDTPY
jgi:catechol 2,3-dioxygenase-like lactoylglutathione lyase family enzyme